MRPADVTPTQAQPRVLNAGYLTVRRGPAVETCLIELSGELDSYATDSLEAELKWAEKSDAVTIVVDLGGLRFIDSSGLRILLFAAQRSRKQGDRLRFLRGSPPVTRMLELCGIDSELTFLD